MFNLCNNGNSMFSKSPSAADVLFPVRDLVHCASKANFKVRKTANCQSPFFADGGRKRGSERLKPCS